MKRRLSRVTLNMWGINEKPVFLKHHSNRWFVPLILWFGRQTVNFENFRIKGVENYRKNHLINRTLFEEYTGYSQVEARFSSDTGITLV